MENVVDNQNDVSENVFKGWQNYVDFIDDTTGKHFIIDLTHATLTTIHRDKTKEIHDANSRT